MERQKFKVKTPDTRPATRYARDARRSFMEASQSLVEHYQQSNTKQASSKPKTSDCASEFCCSLWSPNYEVKLLSGKSSKSNASPELMKDDTPMYGPPKEFYKNFSSLLSDPIFSDVEIKCGDEVIKAHKNVLASRSPVFNAMFNNLMVESATGVVSIIDLEPQVIRDLLTFIYCNKVQSLSLMKAFGLLEAATKYQIQTLKDICVDYLAATMTPENSLLILQKADLYDAVLKTFTISCVSQEFFSLRETDDWINLQKVNPVLALEVCNRVIDKLANKH